MSESEGFDATAVDPADRPDGEDRAAGDKGDAAASERARALLEATHAFPCEYFLMVIARSDESITERLVAAVNQAATRPLDPAGADILLRPSAGGKYVSHRFSVQVAHAGEVLRLYEIVKSVDGVITVM